MHRVILHFSVAKRIDLAGGVPCAEAIINIHDRHTAAATIQHPEQRGESAETRPVAYAGGNRYNRL